MKKMMKTTAAVIALVLLLGGCGKTKPVDNTTAPTQPSTLPSVQLPTTPGAKDVLTCLEISRFSGNFVETGKERPVKDVAAILVQNDSDKFLDLALVTYKVGDRTAQFRVSGLPAGRKAWVMESNALTLAEGDELEFDECKESFNANAITVPDGISVKREGKSLTLTNTSDKALKNVTAYYKNTMEGGIFLGGITYVISFGDMEPGDTVTKSADHFGNNSEIVRYSYQ